MRSAIDARIVNAGVDVYRHFNNRHLETVGSERIDAETVFLIARTNQSQIRMAQAVRASAFVENERVAAEREVVQEQDRIWQQFDVEVGEGGTLRLEKTVCIFTSRDHAVSECAVAARKNIRRAPRRPCCCPITSSPGSICGAASTSISSRPSGAFH